MARTKRAPLVALVHDSLALAPATVAAAAMMMNLKQETCYCQQLSQSNQKLRRRKSDFEIRIRQLRSHQSCKFNCPIPIQPASKVLRQQVFRYSADEPPLEWPPTTKGSSCSCSAERSNWLDRLRTDRRRPGQQQVAGRKSCPDLLIGLRKRLTSSSRLYPRRARLI